MALRSFSRGKRLGRQNHKIKRTRWHRDRHFLVAPDSAITSQFLTASNPPIFDIGQPTKARHVAFVVGFMHRLIIRFWIDDYDSRFLSFAVTMTRRQSKR